ncbi:hypothetical protein NQZ68_025180 [Dissostichus eleginoides]|nr:hypothetical protein NQZ68_025180 [Dissostichus eleginoides]
MNLTDCDDAFMKQKELLFLPLALLDFQIGRCFLLLPIVHVHHPSCSSPELKMPLPISATTSTFYASRFIEVQRVRDAPPETSVPYFSNNAP